MKEFTPPPDSASIVSVTDRVKPVALGMAVTSAHFLADRAAFVGGEENVALVDAKGEIAKVAVHSGGILSTAFDGKRLVMGGDDGKVVSLDAKGEVTLLATDPKRRWIDAVALHADGAFAWSAGKTATVKSGKGLATSGADTVIIWPFGSKDGPMGKEPAMLAPLQARVSVVACHPRNDILAAGYSDGTVLMVRLEDGAEILVRRNGTPPVAAIAWNAKGTLLAFADENGDGGLLEL
jgi:WD40 repeat protein